MTWPTCKKCDGNGVTMYGYATSDKDAMDIACHALDACSSCGGTARRGLRRYYEAKHRLRCLWYCDIKPMLKR